MKILISGASGLVGSKLKPILEKSGHSVSALVRNKEQSGVYWSPSREELDVSGMEGFEAIIHLAGENIADGRWNDEKKKKIYQSRIDGTKMLVAAFKSMKNPPKVFLSASAIGYYGDQGDKEVDEESDPGAGFLSRVCMDWEAAARPAMDLGIRTVMMRIGVVMSAEGGALSRMIMPFRLGLGGKLGSGNQFMPCIDIDDLVRAMKHCLETESLQGPVNLVGPEPVRQRDFAKTLADLFRRPCFFHTPAFALKLAAGELAKELLLPSYRVLPKKLKESGFEFKFPRLEDSLRNQLSEYL